MSSTYEKYDQVVEEAKEPLNNHFENPKQETEALSSEFVKNGVSISNFCHVSDYHMPDNSPNYLTVGNLAEYYFR